MSLVTLASLLVRRTKAELVDAGLSLVSSLGVATSRLAPRDPTRSLYHFITELLDPLEAIVAAYVASGFLGSASGPWLTLLAHELYDVDRVEGTRATAGVVLENIGGGFYEIAPGDLAVQHNTTGKTYTNTTGGTLAASDGITATSLEVIFVADEIGSESSAIGGDLGTLTTTLLGVTLAFSTDAVGLDEEDDDSLRDRCRAKIGMLSPCGPSDAYSYVVRASELTGVTDITRARVVGDSGTGEVPVYIAGPAGPVAGASVTAAQLAVEKWAAPINDRPTVYNASGVAVTVTYEAWFYDSVPDDEPTIKANIHAALTRMFSRRPIGGDIIAGETSGKLYRSLILSTIRSTYPEHTFRVVLTSPVIDTPLTISQVATLTHDPTTSDATVHLEETPS